MSDLDPLFQSADRGPSHDVLGITHKYLARTGETGGRFLSFEVDVPPGAMVPMHHHAVDSECFYVLDGELTFFTPDQTRTAGPGEFAAFMPGSPRSRHPGSADILSASLSDFEFAWQTRRPLSLKLGDRRDSGKRWHLSNPVQFAACNRFKSFDAAEFSCFSAVFGREL